MAYERTLQAMTWADAGHMAPELILIAMMAVLIMLDLLLPRRVDRSLIGWLSLASLLGSFVSVVWRIQHQADQSLASEALGLLNDNYRIDDFGAMFKLLLLTAAALIVLWSLGAMKQGSSGQLVHQGEYYYLMLPATAGAMLMTSTGDLITLYTGLELLSISTYVLVGLRARRALTAQAASSEEKVSAKPAEAAFKYVVTGGISSAFILFGMSYLYGLTGSTHVGEIGSSLPQAVESFRGLIYLAFFFMAAGFGIKIAAAPFHAWAPDVYEGAPTPVSAFLAVVSKTAAAVALFRLFYNVVFPESLSNGSTIGHDLFRAVLAVAACAMIVGTLSALRQHNMKRLLALSGVANAGYLIAPIGLSFYGVHSNNAAELFFYAAAYLCMNIGAFAVLSIVAGSRRDADGSVQLRSFEGLYHRAPWTAGAMIIFVLSLAGLPISGGFFGKLFVMMGAASSHAYWLVAIMAGTSVISYYVYFGIVRQMFMRSSGDEPVHVPAASGIVVWLCAAATLVLGVYPNGLLHWFEHVFSVVGDLLILR
ncbi:proton-translocating NADH-quinone oxidoreductase chain N [Paenibacillus cellulosilyticus]|uniref:NADH-quinone oxidoreductase subunit N n=1 Tax=Paenibacillus cellulosilyticus TaxID=375489 RepID=A0A2V2Z0L7_9BACL|nr:NADH-quinone oxidoreductase subunit N [Paenibacillus cellulosilyticus]PWW08397.1 proton-translocating NADH-quinone oxidoreductase chain N [Paenibacillus cellulosilyticus]QKS47988.1 NADH-quinone oxidoreductase subunit N [Paenibacillus cellulosilyticus]